MYPPPPLPLPPAKLGQMLVSLKLVDFLLTMVCHTSGPRMVVMRRPAICPYWASATSNLVHVCTCVCVCVCMRVSVCVHS